MALYVGTNYHPHDWTPERWKKDIALMKEAGFQAVRLGHLCWDSYEPQDGVYNFQWFDEVMNGFYAVSYTHLDVYKRQVEDYIKIQQMRYPECLDFSLECDADRKEEWVPPLLLQTFIENGIKHNITLVPRLRCV